MLRRDYTIISKEGLHLRPISLLAECAAKFSDTEVTLHKDENTAMLNSVISVMGLCLTEKSNFSVAVNGGDETSCMEAIEAVLKEEKII